MSVGVTLLRRRFVGAAAFAALGGIGPRVASAGAVRGAASAPSLREMAMQPLLVQELYQQSFSGDFDESGACELNRRGYVAIGFQRWGADWVTQGLAVGRPEWVQRGWRQLDYGLSFQQPNGGFGGGDAFFSSGQFMEALARACTLDPERGASRMAALERAALWHMSPAVEAASVPENRPYTHRFYLFAAALGLTGALTGNRRLAMRAEAWAREGLSLQTPDGVNPEAGGFDANYQLVGLLVAMRYLTACRNARLRAGLRAMARRAVDVELARQGAAGEIDERGSTRVGHEHLLNGKLKTVNYRDATLALSHLAVGLGDPRLLRAAAGCAAVLHNR